MNPVEIQVPNGAEVVNCIYSDMQLDDLTPNLLTVALPNGYYIDAGWYPEGDPNGRYYVRVFFEDWSRQQLDPPLVTRSLGEMIQAVELLARRFNARQVALSRSRTETHEATF